MMATFNGLSEEETEWEYEYDLTTITTSYIILDLPRKEPPNSKGKRKGVYSKDLFTSYYEPSNSNSRGKRRRRHRDNVTGELQPLPTDESGDESADDEEPEQNDGGHADVNEDTTEVPTAKPQSLRIVGLHEKQPLIAYNDEFYQCDWRKGIGSELIFLPHADAVARGLDPLLELGTYDLAGMASARLVAKPVLVHRRPAEEAPIGITDETFAADDDGSLFREKLAAMQRERGELDSVNSRRRPGKGKEIVVAEAESPSSSDTSSAEIEET